MLLYGFTLYFPFNFDGIFYLVNNPLLKKSSNFAFFTDFSGFATSHERMDVIQDLVTNFILRPVSYLTFHLNYYLGGLNPAGFRAVNILIHASNAWLLFLVLGRTIRQFQQPDQRDTSSALFIPAAVAFLFLTHPLQTESVTYIVQRFTSLAVLFVLLALYGALRAANETDIRRSQYLRIGVMAALVLGMLSKESAATGPVLVLIAEILLVGVPVKQSLRRSWCYLIPLPLIPLLMVMISAAQNHGQIRFSETLNLVNFSDDYVNPIHYSLSQPGVILSYLRLLFLPIGQNVDPDPAVVTTWLSLRFLVPMVTIMALIVAACLVAKRHGRNLHASLFCFGTLWFFIFILPSSSIVPLPDLMAEHRSYEPSVGFFIVVAAALDLIRLQFKRFPRLQYAVPGTTALWVIILCGATIHRNEVWRTSVSLWSNAVAGSPLKGRSWDNLGVCQFQEGNVEEAILSLRKSLEVDPGHVESYQKLGMILSLQNRYQESLAVTEEGLKRAPENADLCYNKGAAFANTGRLNEAKEWLLRAIQLRSNYGFAHFSLGSLYAALRDYERALNHLRMAESLMPGDPRITAAISQLPVTTDNTGG